VRFWCVKFIALVLSDDSTLAIPYKSHGSMPCFNPALCQQVVSAPMHVAGKTKNALNAELQIVLNIIAFYLQQSILLKTNVQIY
jgi:hypothetical protein